MVAAITDAKNILVEETQSIVAPKCLFIHHNPTPKLGIPATKVVTIKPVIPNMGISVRPKGSPNPKLMRASFIVTFVSPCPFRKFPKLRFPKPE